MRYEIETNLEKFPFTCEYREGTWWCGRPAPYIMEGFGRPGFVYKDEDAHCLCEAHLPVDAEIVATDAGQPDQAADKTLDTNWTQNVHRNAISVQC